MHVVWGAAGGTIFLFFRVGVHHATARSPSSLPLPKLVFSIPLRPAPPDFEARALYISSYLNLTLRALAARANEVGGGGQFIFIAFSFSQSLAPLPLPPSAT